MNAFHAPKEKVPRAIRGKVAFLALQPTIRTELEQGVRMVTIYKRYASQLGVSYSQFARYVCVHIRGKAIKPRSNSRGETAPARTLASERR